jgi:hypothetical protein
MQTQTNPEQSHERGVGAEADVRHLCDTCRNDFATCGTKMIVWGIDRDPTATGADADAVLECDGFLSA